MEERRGRALFWAARLAILAAAAGYALAVITSGGGDDTVSIYGYELLTLLPEYAREYGEANHWLGVGLTVCWGAVGGRRAGAFAGGHTVRREEQEKMLRGQRAVSAVRGHKPLCVQRVQRYLGG